MPRRQIATSSFLESIWTDVVAHEIRMPMEGIFPDMTRRGFLKRLEPALLGSRWVQRWVVLSDMCLYLFASPTTEVPLTIVPLTGVVASECANAPDHGYGFELRAADDAAGPLVYTEKERDSAAVKQGKESRLTFAAATADERTWWLSDLAGENTNSSPTLMPLVLKSDKSERAARRVKAIKEKRRAAAGRSNGSHAVGAPASPMPSSSAAASSSSSSPPSSAGSTFVGSKPSSAPASPATLLMARQASAAGGGASAGSRRA